MTAAKKFLFETSFDEADGRRPMGGAAGTTRAAESAPPPTFSEADLAAARADALTQGKQQGFEEAKRLQEQSVAEALGNLNRQLEAMARGFVEAEQARGQAALQAAVRMVRTLFPRLARSHAITEVETVVTECVDRLREEPRIVVRVPDPLLDPLRERLGPLVERSGFEGKIVLLADETLGESAVKVEWADGGAERDPQKSWREIEEILTRSVGLSNIATDENPTEPAGASGGPVPIPAASATG